MAITRKHSTRVNSSTTATQKKTYSITVPFVDSGFIRVSDILVFYNTYTKKDNDAANKKRETILEIILCAHPSFLTHPEFGDKWCHIQKQWMESIHRAAKELMIPSYTSVEVERIGGRGSNYDFEFRYKNEGRLVGSVKIEFKYGAKNINNLPQFLSLPAKFALLQETFDVYWYHNGYDKYRACDPSLKEPKPSLEEYQRVVVHTQSKVHPAIDELRTQEENFKMEKKRVVKSLIGEFLKKYEDTTNLSAFTEKVKETQTNKIYLLWKDGMFHMDKIDDSEMNDIAFHSIKNGNTLLLKSGNTSYHALLRWKNHQGILGPAWQISLRR